MAILRICLRLGLCVFLYETILEEDFWHSFLNSPVKEEINFWNSWWGSRVHRPFPQILTLFQIKTCCFHTRFQTSSVYNSYPLLDLAFKSCSRFAGTLSCQSVINVLFKYVLLFSIIWHVMNRNSFSYLTTRNWLFLTNTPELPPRDSYQLWSRQPGRATISRRPPESLRRLLKWQTACGNGPFGILQHFELYIL